MNLVIYTQIVNTIYLWYYMAVIVKIFYVKMPKKLDIMLSNLNEMLVKGRKAMFGKSSENLGNIEGSEQLSLFNEAE